MKIKTVLVFCLMLCVICMQSVFAQVLTTSASDETVAVGDNIVFSVKADAESLSGMQFNIEYDKDVFEYSQLVSSELFDDAIASGINTDNPGGIAVLMGFVEKQKINGEILNVTFKVKGSTGDKSIKVSNIKLAVNGENITEDDIVVEFKIESGDQTSSGDNKEASTSTPSTSGGSSSSGSSVSGGSSSSAGVSLPQSGGADIVIKPEQSGSDNDKENDTKQEATENVTVVKLTDISGHWAEENIKSMVSQGVVNGFEDNTFAPDQKVKRSEFATMISKALGLSEVAENIYSDVSENAWYKDAVLKCTKAELIKGDAGMFRPDDYISREEMTVIIHRAKKYLGLTDEESASVNSSFADDNEIADWAKQAVVCMTQDGIIKGMDGNVFAPKLSATRAQAVVVLEKLLNLK